VDTLVSRLRRRIEPGDSRVPKNSEIPKYVLTVRGVGYKLGEI
jgi:DNA-binding response OmpR family regulator